jgi:putative ABC transport system substrate-binding protein
MHAAIKSHRTLTCALLLCLFVAAPNSCLAENLKVLVLLSDNSAPYQSFAIALNNDLPASMRTTVLEHPEQLARDLPQADLIVAVGRQATELAATQKNTPVLAAMIPRLGFEELLVQAREKKTSPLISAIYIDQPWARQFDFLRIALPDRNKIGLLYSQNSHIDIASLHKDITQRGGFLVTQMIRSPDELYSGLESLLASSNVLLAIPDSLIYNNSNIRNILLTTYRRGDPVIGLSHAYVNAGALAAIFSTPEQLAAQTGTTVISFAQTGQLPEPQYPVSFSIAVNQQVARSLEIKLSSPEVIRNQMIEEENKRK